MPVARAFLEEKNSHVGSADHNHAGVKETRRDGSPGDEFAGEVLGGNDHGGAFWRIAPFMVKVWIKVTGD